MTVLCLVEHDGSAVIDASLRALSFARALAESSSDPLAAVLVGEVSPSTLEVLGAFGVSRAYGVESEEIVSYAPVAWARALIELAASATARAVVAAGTDRGNEVHGPPGRARRTPHGRQLSQRLEVAHRRR